MPIFTSSKWIGFQFIGSKAFKKFLTEKENKLKRQRNVNKKAIVYLDKWIQDNFKSQGRKAEGGSGWKELAPVTIEARQARARAGTGAAPMRAPQILINNATLKGRWKHLYTHTQAAIQSGVHYGVYHDSDDPRKKLPQRKILPRKKQVWPDLKTIYKRFLNEVLRD